MDHKCRLIKRHMTTRSGFARERKRETQKRELFIAPNLCQKPFSFQAQLVLKRAVRISEMISKENCCRISESIMDQHQREIGQLMDTTVIKVGYNNKHYSMVETLRGFGLVASQAARSHSSHE